MVRTQHDSKDLPPLEKIKLLQAEQKKRKEELEALEKEKKKELEKTREQISESIREQEEHTEEQFEEEERQRHKEPELENIVEEEAPKQAPPVVQYGDALQAIRQGQPGNVYTMSNYNVANEMERLQEKASQGQLLTSTEQQFVENTQYNMQRIERENVYVSGNQQTYVGRVEGALKEIDKQLHLRG